MSTDTPTPDTLVDALVDAFRSMTGHEQRLIVTGWRLLSVGERVDLGVLAEAAGWSRDDVEVRLRSWPGGASLDHDGRLVGLWGMAVTDVSAHRATIADGAAVWMWCALDPLFIVPATGSPAEVTSVCPTTEEPIRVHVGPDGVSAIEPASTVVTFLVPDGPFSDDVREEFCHFVLFFASPEAAEPWVSSHPGTFSLSVAEAAEVGRRLAARAFPTPVDRGRIHASVPRRLG